MVPENVLILYDRAVFDDKAYVSDDEFRAVLASFGKTEEEILAATTLCCISSPAPRVRVCLQLRQRRAL